MQGETDEELLNTIFKSVGNLVTSEMKTWQSICKKSAFVSYEKLCGEIKTGISSYLPLSEIFIKVIKFLGHCIENNDHFENVPRKAWPEELEPRPFYMVNLVSFLIYFGKI